MIIQKDLLFDVAIATIFAREFLEGFVIIGNYRTVIQRRSDWDEDTKNQALKAVTCSASLAFTVGMYANVLEPLSLRRFVFFNLSPSHNLRRFVYCDCCPLPLRP